MPIMKAEQYAGDGAFGSFSTNHVQLSMLCFQDSMLIFICLYLSSFSMVAVLSLSICISLLPSRSLPVFVLVASTPQHLQIDPAQESLRFWNFYRKIVALLARTLTAIMRAIFERWTLTRGNDRRVPVGMMVRCRFALHTEGGRHHCRVTHPRAGFPPLSYPSQKVPKLFEELLCAFWGRWCLCMHFLLPVRQCKFMLGCISIVTG